MIPALFKQRPLKELRGERAEVVCPFEQRLKGVIKSLQGKPNAILFIDEIHTLIGAGAASGGTLDASNLLKPALSSGQLKCIGATTFTEYRGIFEKDAALSRRFQKVDVVEPSIEQTVDILKGLKSRFEEHHSVKYALAALQAAAELSAKYINDRHLPDKAIDLILHTPGGLVLAAELIRGLIYRRGHSISYDERSAERCTMTGKRADTGDSLTVTWSLEDAKRAFVLMRELYGIDQKLKRRAA